MKSRISISTLIFVFGAVTALGLAAILGVSDYASRQLRVGGPLYDQIKLGNDLVADILPPPEYVLEAYLEATLAVRDPSTVAQHKKRLAQLHKDYDGRRAYWKNSALASELKSDLTRSDAQVQQFWAIAEQELLPALEKKDAAAAAYDKLEKAYTAHRVVIDELVNKANDANSALEISAAQSVSTFTTVVWLVSAIVGLIITAGVLGIAFGVVRPLSKVTVAMRQMAAGAVGVIIPGAARSDEIGDMAKAVVTIRDNAEQRAREESELKARRQEEAAAERKRDLHKLASDFEQAVGEIIDTVSSSSTQLEASAGTLTSLAARSQNLATHVATATQEASANVQSVASATEEMTSSVQEIGRQVQDSAGIARQAVEQVRSTTDRVSELSKAASRIGDVVELINTIASQTNLLALNATIEAARAGEAGRGFAVVASEVKLLAEQTARATGDISIQIAGIQGATKESVVAIEAVRQIIDRLSEISGTIAAAVEEQGAATREISRNIQQVAKGTEHVSSNVADVKVGAEATGSASSEVLTAAQSLASESGRLKHQVGHFLATVRAS